MSEFTTSCSCSDGYEGENCQKKGKIQHKNTLTLMLFVKLHFTIKILGILLVYPCDSSPCKNGGTCANAENTFKCSCEEKYEGDTCENRGLFIHFVVTIISLQF